MKVEISSQVQENELSIFEVIRCTTSKISSGAYALVHR